MMGCHALCDDPRLIGDVAARGERPLRAAASHCCVAMSSARSDATAPRPRRPGRSRALGAPPGALRDGAQSSLGRNAESTETKWPRTMNVHNGHTWAPRHARHSSAVSVVASRWGGGGGGGGCEAARQSRRCVDKPEAVFHSPAAEYHRSVRARNYCGNNAAL